MSTVERHLRISVIIPMYDVAKTVARTLDALVPQLGEDDELILVDDGSTDATVAIASGYPARLIELPTHRGLSGTRNAAAAVATGDYLLFTDADAVAPPGFIDRARGSLLADGGCAALVGVYAADCGPANLASRVKNLWIRHSYLRAGAGGTIDWLFGCCSAIRRDLFEELGGFDDRYHRNTGGEDIELGLRLVRAGHRIRFDPGLEVLHLRHHDVRGLLVNDFRRAAGYFDLGLSRFGIGGLLRRRRFANIEPGYLAGLGLLAAGLPLTSLGAVCPPLLGPGVLSLTAYGVLNSSYYRYLHRHGGARLAGAGAALLAGSQLAGLAGIGRAGIGRAVALGFGTPDDPRCGNIGSLDKAPPGEQ